MVFVPGMSEYCLPMSGYPISVPLVVGVNCGMIADPIVEVDG